MTWTDATKPEPRGGWFRPGARETSSQRPSPTSHAPTASVSIRGRDRLPAYRFAVATDWGRSPPTGSRTRAAPPRTRTRPGGHSVSRATLASAYHTLWNATTTPSATPASSHTPTTPRTTTLARADTSDVAPGAHRTVHDRTRRYPGNSHHRFPQRHPRTLLPGAYPHPKSRPARPERPPCTDHRRRPSPAGRTRPRDSGPQRQSRFAQKNVPSGIPARFAPRAATGRIRFPLAHSALAAHSSLTLLARVLGRSASSGIPVSEANGK
jgi:hypothetical protein